MYKFTDLRKTVGRLFFLLFLVNFVVTPYPQTKLTKATFIPHWLPQAQFAGYYAAYELGLYKKHGIDLQILTGGPDNSSVDLLKKGKADFGLLWLPNAVQMRDQGIKIVNIAQMVQKSALMLVAKKSSGIKEPKDLQGKKISTWKDFQLQPLAFLKKYSLNVKQLPQGGSINLFLLDAVQVTSAMWYNEYHTILNSGYKPDELTTFFMADYGLNFPEEGLYVSEEFYNKDSVLCREFVKASIEGWLWAFQNSDKAIDIVIKYMKAANLPVNKAHQNWMLSRFRDIMLTKGRIADVNLSGDDYNFVSKTLKEYGSIKSIPDFRNFCRHTQ